MACGAKVAGPIAAQAKVAAGAARAGPAADDHSDGVVGDDAAGGEGRPGEHGDRASGGEPSLDHVALVRVPVLREHRVRHDLQRIISVTRMHLRAGQGSFSRRGAR